MYPEIYYLKVSGVSVHPHSAGKTFDGERIDLVGVSTVEEAADKMQAYLDYLQPGGRVELWAAQWHGGRRGKFVHTFIRSKS